MKSELDCNNIIMKWFIFCDCRYKQACGLLDVRKSHILKKLAALRTPEPPPTVVEEKEQVEVVPIKLSIISLGYIWLHCYQSFIRLLKIIVQILSQNQHHQIAKVRAFLQLPLKILTLQPRQCLRENHLNTLMEKVMPVCWRADSLSTRSCWPLRKSTLMTSRQSYTWAKILQFFYGFDCECLLPSSELLWCHGSWREHQHSSQTERQETYCLWKSTRDL